jgi:hypothetical protein
METQIVQLDSLSLATRRLRASGRFRGVLLALAIAVVPTALRAASSMQLHAEPRLLEILHEQRTVLTYPFATNLFKPYVRELITLDGVDLLRDAPADHLHHHGLMYGIKVNDINFWEEAPHAGRQVPQADLVRDVKKLSDGRSLAQFTQVLHWVSSTNAGVPDTTPVALLIEKRTIGLTIQAASERLYLEWRSEFTVGPGTPLVTLTGSSYHGLGIRFRADFDGVAERFNSEALPYPEDGLQGVLPTRWMAVSHVVAGRPYTLTLFQHPANPGQLRFFSMQKAFTYLSATQGLDEAPLIYRAGDRWTIRHLLLVSPGRLSQEQLDRQYESFAQP